MVLSARADVKTNKYDSALTNIISHWLTYLLFFLCLILKIIPRFKYFARVLISFSLRIFNLHIIYLHSKLFASKNFFGHRQQYIRKIHYLYLLCIQNINSFLHSFNANFFFRLFCSKALLKIVVMDFNLLHEYSFIILLTSLTMFNYMPKKNNMRQLTVVTEGHWEGKLFLKSCFDNFLSCSPICVHWGGNL